MYDNDYEDKIVSSWNNEISNVKLFCEIETIDRELTDINDIYNGTIKLVKLKFVAEREKEGGFKLVIGECEINITDRSIEEPLSDDALSLLELFTVKNLQDYDELCDFIGLYNLMEV